MAKEGGKKGAKKRVAVLISGRGSNMTALIKAAKSKNYPAQIALVISNEPAAEGLKHARKAGITTAIIDHRPHGKNREAFERALQAELERHNIDLVCLAGFMRLLTPWFVGRWNGRMLNIHPCPAAGIQGPRYPRPRARGRRKDPRRDGPFRGAGDGFRARSSRRPRWRSPKTTRPRRLPPASSSWNTASIRSRSSWRARAHADRQRPLHHQQNGKNK